MTRHEFRNEYLRLQGGFGKAEEPQPARLDAMYEVIGHYDLSAMRAAVTQCLRGDRMPSFEKLHAACDYAADVARRRRHEQAGTVAAVNGYVARVPDVAELAGVRLFSELASAAWSHDLPPGVVADELERYTAEYPWLAEDIAELRGMGDHWRNVDGHPTDAELEAVAVNRSRRDA